MLDSDLAKLFATETKHINEAVRRNIKKFPERFSWILTKKANERGGRRYDIRVFTEHGFVMLSTI